MANAEHLAKLNEGVDAWNQWKRLIPAIDLGEADLTGANLSRVNLSRADLYAANLSDADLSRAILAGANLREANLAGTYLHGANLRHANLSGASLVGANLVAVSLERQAKSSFQEPEIIQPTIPAHHRGPQRSSREHCR